MDKSLSSVGMGPADWQDMGLYQLGLLQERGLRRGHSVLDAGCGSFRLGIHLIPYVGDGQYYGIDANLELLAKARREVLKESGLTDYHPHTLAADLTLGQGFEGTFDYIWCYAVLDHIPPAKLHAAFATLGRCTGPETRTFATAFISATDGPQNWLYNGQNRWEFTTYRGCNPWHYRLDEIEAAARAGGLRHEAAGFTILARYCPLALMEFRKE